MIVAAAPIYEDYAPIYDAIGQGRFSARMAAWALAWLAERGIRQPARVLDLACGTGEAALVFAAAGCEVTGVDQSVAMLDIARGKARDARYDLTFVRGDIRELPTNDGRLTTNGAILRLQSIMPQRTIHRIQRAHGCLALDAPAVG